MENAELCKKIGGSPFESSCLINKWFLRKAGFLCDDLNGTLLHDLPDTCQLPLSALSTLSQEEIETLLRMEGHRANLRDNENTPVYKKQPTYEKQESPEPEGCLTSSGVEKAVSMVQKATTIGVRELVRAGKVASPILKKATILGVRELVRAGKVASKNIADMACETAERGREQFEETYQSEAEYRRSRPPIRRDSEESGLSRGIRESREFGEKPRKRRLI